MNSAAVRKIALFVLGVWGGSLSAHPVSFKGGHELIFNSTLHGWDLRFLYSPSARWALGPYSMVSGSRYDAGLQASVLVHRGHWDGSQSNIYLWGGAGGVTVKQGTAKGGGLGGVQADFETRDFYSAWMSEWGFRAHASPRFEHKARLGLAPYRGDDLQLNTWFVLETSYGKNPWWGQAAQWELTPLLRFYYQNVLWELGVSHHGQFKLNWMLHM